jgi:hypothetical protein
MTLNDMVRAAFVGAVREAIRTEGLEATIVDKVADRPGYATVRVNTPTGIVEFDARCQKVLPQKGAPVIIKKGRDLQWEVTEDDPRLATTFWNGKGGGNVGPHAASHGLGGTDPLLLDQRALLTLRVSPTVPESLSVYLGPYVYRYGGTWHWWGGDYVDLTGLSPVNPSYQKVVVVGLDGSSGTSLVIEGNEVYKITNELTFTGDDVRAALEAGAAPDDFIPAAAIRLIHNASAVYNGDIFLGAKQLAAADVGGAQSGFAWTHTISLDDIAVFAGGAKDVWNGTYWSLSSVLMDNSVIEGCSTAFQLPSTLPASYTATLHLWWKAETDTGDCVWRADHSALGAPTILDSAPSLQDVFAASSAGFTNTIQKASQTLTTTGWDAGELLLLRIMRVGSATEDTLPGQARLLAAQVVIEETG